MEKRSLIRICWLVVLSSAPFSIAQLAPDSQIPDADLVPRCHRVWLVSENTATNTTLILEKLRIRGELTEARIVLAKSEAEADVTVRVTGDENDALLFALRKADGATAMAKLVALAEFPGIVAGRIIDTLHELCPAVMTTSRWLRSGREPLPAAAMIQLAAARSLSVSSNTSAMDENKLARYLRTQPEIQEWKLKVDAENSSDDLRLAIDRDIENLIEWKYEIFSASGESLLVGRTAAFGEEHAARAITRRVLQQFSRYRSRAGRGSNSQTGVDSPELDDHRIYRVKLVTDDPRTTGTPLQLTITEGRLLARNSLGQAVLNIEAPDLEDTDVSSIRDPVLDGTEGLADSIEGTGDPILGAGLLLAYTGLAIVSTPVAPRAHLIDIAWSDGTFYQSATLQAERRDIGPLMRGLHRLQGLPGEH